MSVYEEWDMECPRCGSDEDIDVSVTVSARLTSDGTDIDGGDHGWDDDSACSCANCGFSGTVASFKAVERLEWSLVSKVAALRTSLFTGEIDEDRFGELSTQAEKEHDAALEALRLASGAAEWRLLLAGG